MKKLPLFLSLISLISVLSLLPARATATPPGLTFDHIVIIAMENQNYGSVIGNSAAPFINNNLTVLGSVMSAYHSYAQEFLERALLVATWQYLAEIQKAHFAACQIQHVAQAQAAAVDKVTATATVMQLLLRASKHEH